MKRVPALIAIVSSASLITVMQIYALSQGIDGTLFSVSVATVAALGAGFAGFRVGRK